MIQTNPLEQLEIASQTLYTTHEIDMEVKSILNLIKNDPSNVDYLMLAGIEFKRTGGLKEAQNMISRSIEIALSYHAYYHYYGAILNTNLYILTGEGVYLDKSIFLDHEYHPALEMQSNGAREEFYNPNLSAFSLQERRDIPSHLGVWSEYEIPLLESQNALEMLLDISGKYDIAHKKYHLYVSNLYNLRAKIYYQQQNYSAAFYDLTRSVEMENSNPHNKLINECADFIASLL